MSDIHKNRYATDKNASGERSDNEEIINKASETYNNQEASVTDKANASKDVVSNVSGNAVGSVLGDSAGDATTKYINEKLGAYTASMGKAEAVMSNPNASPEQKAAAGAIAAGEMGLALYGQVTGFLGEMSEKMMMPILEQLAKFKGEAILPIAKQLDPVLGFSCHYYMLSPVPLPNPYIGLLFRAADFISCALASILPTPERAEEIPEENEDKSNSAEISAAITDANTKNALALGHQVATMGIGMIGATVKIGNFIPRVTAGTPAINIFHEIMPIFGPLLPSGPYDRNKGHVFLGSLFVVADGAPLTGGFLHLHNPSYDPPFGIPSIHAPLDGHFYIPTAMILPIPWNKPILVSPFPTPINPLTIFDRIFRAALTKLKKNKDNNPSKEKPCNRLSKLLHKLNDKLGEKFPNLAKKIRQAINTYVGHPISVADGFLFTDEEDFSLPGPIPLVWERVWYSDSHYQGPLGSGWHHSYDWGLVVHAEEQFAVLRMGDGRVALFDQIPLTDSDSPRYNRTEKIYLHKHKDGFYYAENSQGLLHNFSPGNFGERQEHKLTSITNRNGYAIRFEYTLGILSKIIDSSGRILIVENDEGRITRIITQAAHNETETIALTEYIYDEEGNMIQQVNLAGDSMYFEYENHLLVKETWRNGVPFYFKYEGTEIGSKCVETWGEGGFLHYRLEYEEGKTTVTDSLGNITVYFHENGIVTHKIDPEGNNWKSVYNEFDELEGTENPLGQISGSTYDDKGNRLTLKQENGSFVQFEYNDPDSPFFPTEAVDSRGGKWKWQYDLQGNLIKKVNPVGAITRFKYTDGLITKIINPDETETLLEYDAQYNLSKIIFPNGTQEELFYDLHGRNIKQVDVKGNYVFREFDSSGRVTRISLPDGNRKKMEYDALDNLVKYKDNQYEVQMEYNVFNKLKIRKQGKTQLEFQYNAEGQLKKISNEKEETYSFFFDKNGRIKEEVSFDGLRTRYQRDAVGKVLMTLKGEKRKTRYEYDPNGYIQRIEYHDGLEEFFEYECGQLSGAYSKFARVNFERDNLGRISKETCDGHEVTSTYNLMGDRIHIGSSLGADIHLGYDDMGNLISQKTEGWESEILRDTYGLEIERNLTGGIQSQWQRDTVGRISQHTVMQKSSLGIRTRFRKNYEWDTNFKLRRIVDQNGQATSFEYDVYGNLSKTEYADGTVQFRKSDETGNLFETPERSDRLYGKGGKLLKTKNARYEYDEVGNLIKKFTKEGEWLYEWNGNGTLRRVRRPDKQDVWFRYDPLGRRTAKKFKSTTTCWVWDGNKPLHEWKEFEAREATTEELTTWVFDENSFIPVAKLRGEKKYSILADHLGTPSQMYNEQGELFWEGSLDSYGRLNLKQGASGSCPFRYQGQYEDEETGLYYNRFRYYSPETGAYISKDPIGLAGGDRFYGYVHDPNIWIDPFGLASKTYKKDQDKLEELGLDNVDLKGKSFNAGKKKLEEAGFKYKETTKTGRVTFEHPEKGTKVHYDGTQKSKGALAGNQSPHWHIQDKYGHGYGSTGLPKDKDKFGGHIPSNKGNSQF